MFLASLVGESEIFPIPGEDLVYIVAHRVALGLKNAGRVLLLPPATTLDSGAIAMRGTRAVFAAVLAEGEAFPASVYPANPAKAGSPADAFTADVGALG